MRNSSRRERSRLSAEIRTLINNLGTLRRMSNQQVVNLLGRLQREDDRVVIEAIRELHTLMPRLEGEVRETAINALQLVYRHHGERIVQLEAANVVIELYLPYLGDPGVRVRMHALYTIGGLLPSEPDNLGESLPSDPELKTSLILAISSCLGDYDANVRVDGSMILTRLLPISVPEVRGALIPVLISCLRDENLMVQSNVHNALKSLLESSDYELEARVIPELISCLGDSNEFVQENAIYVLYKSLPTSVDPGLRERLIYALIPCITHNNEAARVNASIILKRLSPIANFDLQTGLIELIHRLADSSEQVRVNANIASATLGPIFAPEMRDRLIPALIPCLGNPNEEVKINASIILATLGPISAPEMQERLMPSFIQCLEDTSEQVRINASIGLIRLWPISTPEARQNLLPVFMPHLRDSNASVRANASYVLATLGQDYDDEVRGRLIGEFFDCLRDPNAYVRIYASSFFKGLPLTLEELSEDEANNLQRRLIPVLIDCLRAPNKKAQLNVSIVLAKLGRISVPEMRERLIPALIPCLGASNEEMRVIAGCVLRNLLPISVSEIQNTFMPALIPCLTDPDKQAKLIRCLEDPNESVWINAGYGLRSSRLRHVEEMQKVLIPVFIHCLGAPNEQVQLNVSIVLAKLKRRIYDDEVREELIPALIRCLRAPNDMVRVNASFTLVKLGLVCSSGMNEALIQGLCRCLGNRNDQVRINASIALTSRSLLWFSNPGTRLLMQALILFLRDPNVEVRINLSSALRRLLPISNYDPGIRLELIQALVLSLRDSNMSVCTNASYILREVIPLSDHEQEELIPALIGCLRAPDDQVRINASVALEKLAPVCAPGMQEDLIHGLSRCLENHNDQVRINAISALRKLLPISEPNTRRGLVQALILFLRDPNVEARINSSSALNEPLLTLRELWQDDEMQELLIPALIGCLRAPDDMVLRINASSALEKLAPVCVPGVQEELVQGLCRCLEDHNDQVRINASSALRKLLSISEPGTRLELIQALILFLRDPNKKVRINASSALKESLLTLRELWQGDEMQDLLIPALIRCLEDRYAVVYSNAIAVLEGLLSVSEPGAGVRQKLILALIPCLGDPRELVRINVSDALKGVPIDRLLWESVIEVLIPLLKSESYGARSAAVSVLRKLQPVSEIAIPALISCLKGTNHDVRVSASCVLTILGPVTDDALRNMLIPALIDCLEDTNEDVRVNVSYALGRLGAILDLDLETQVKAKLTLLLEDGNTEVRRNAKEALRNLSTTPTLEVQTGREKVLETPDATSFVPDQEEYKDDNASVGVPHSTTPTSASFPDPHTLIDLCQDYLSTTEGQTLETISDTLVKMIDHSRSFKLYRYCISFEGDIYYFSEAIYKLIIEVMLDVQGTNPNLEEQIAAILAPSLDPGAEESKGSDPEDVVTTQAPYLLRMLEPTEESKDGISGGDPSMQDDHEMLTTEEENALTRALETTKVLHTKFEEEAAKIIEKLQTTEIEGGEFNKLLLKEIEELRDGIKELKKELNSLIEEQQRRDQATTPHHVRRARFNKLCVQVEQLAQAAEKGMELQRQESALSPEQREYYRGFTVYFGVAYNEAEIMFAGFSGRRDSSDVAKALEILDEVAPAFYSIIPIAGAVFAGIKMATRVHGNARRQHIYEALFALEDKPGDIALLSRSAGITLARLRGRTLVQGRAANFDASVRSAPILNIEGSVDLESVLANLPFRLIEDAIPGPEMQGKYRKHRKQGAETAKSIIEQLYRVNFNGVDDSNKVGRLALIGLGLLSIIDTSFTENIKLPGEERSTKLGSAWRKTFISSKHIKKEKKLLTNLAVNVCMENPDMVINQLSTKHGRGQLAIDMEEVAQTISGLYKVEYGMGKPSVTIDIDREANTHVRSAVTMYQHNMENESFQAR